MAAGARTDEDLLATVRAVLPDLQALYLFGSRADGTATADSDYDLAVSLPGPPDPVALWQAGETLAHQLGAEVDLVDLRAASTVMQHQIVTTGRRLFAADWHVDAYELFILREMMEFDAGRAALLADIRREGTVHGR